MTITMTLETRCSVCGEVKRWDPFSPDVLDRIARGQLHPTSADRRITIPESMVVHRCPGPIEG